VQSIYTYQNYRKFLEDFYSDKKKRDPQYSYKSFSIAAGIKSPNYLTLVIEGSRNLTIANIQQFAIALQLRPDEIDYFETLVLFNQSKLPIEQSYYKNRLLSLKKDKPRSIRKSSPFEFLKEWYSTAILVLSHGRSLEDAAQKCKLEIQLPLDKIHQTISNLLDVGLLQLVDEKLQISSQQLTMSDPKSLNLSQEIYLSAQLEQSMKAFRRGYKQKKGKFLSHTLTVPKNFLEEIQKEFISFMENLTEKMDQKIIFDQEELAQINIQIFKPLA
jgi:uncharacterized protein (TIGR02147 family)